MSLTLLVKHIMRLLFSFLFSIIFFLNSFGGNNDSITHIVEKYIDETEPVMPYANVLFEKNISDISICTGPDKTYYLTGTVGDKFGVQQGIMIWASRDMKDWNPIGRDKGYVWTFENDALEWQKSISSRNGWPQRGIIAPQIQFFNKTFWIAYTNSNSNRSGIMKSVSGRAQGPYKDISGDEPLVNGVNASLFQDTDSTVYFIWGNGLIQRMKSDMSGFAYAEPRVLTDANGNRLSIEGLKIAKIDKKYVVSGSRWSSSSVNQQANKTQVGEKAIDDRYDGVLAVSDQLLGNYKYCKNTFPHAGSGQLFMNPEKELFFAFAGVDVGNPMASNPSLLPVEIDEEGYFHLKYKMPLSANPKIPIIYVSRDGNNSNGNSWENAFSSIQLAIDNALQGTQIWIARGTYEGPIEINLREGLYLYGGFKGIEDALNQRNTEKYQVVINGRNQSKSVMTVKSSTYVRIDGITIVGGNASGLSLFQQYGGGMHILGGGETVRIVNCHFENNNSNQDGGALYASIGAAPLLIGCSFKNNVSMNNGGAVAVYCNTSNGYKARLYNCTFDNNLAFSHGGALFFDTNKRDFGLLNIINCLFVNNVSLGENGIITLNGNANLVMVNSTLCFNNGPSRGAVIGSLGKVPAKSRIYNSLFYRNNGAYLFAIEGEAELNGDKAGVANTWVRFQNCLFEQNGVNALVQRNFDKKKWTSADALNQSVMGNGCVVGEPNFVDFSLGNFQLNGSSSAMRKGSSQTYFKYNMNGNLRSSGNVNVGCY